MFEISDLKAKKLVELQEIAKAIGLKKTSQLKKLDLIYKILDTQAEAIKEKTPVTKEAKTEAAPKKEEQPKVKETETKKKLLKLLLIKKLKNLKEDVLLKL